MTETLVLLDNTVLSNFALVQQTEMVMRVCPGVCTTATAFAEYAAAVEKGLLQAGIWSSLPVIELTDRELHLLEMLPARLGPGERTCLAVAIQRGGVVATDDLDARQLARRSGVGTTGTLGILVLAVGAGEVSVDHANRLLAEMIASGFRSPVKSLNVLIDIHP
jgi:predicted nucleic acid-binding protein